MILASPQTVHLAWKNIFHRQIFFTRIEELQTWNSYDFKALVHTAKVEVSFPATEVKKPFSTTLHTEMPPVLAPVLGWSMHVYLAEWCIDSTSCHHFRNPPPDKSDVICVQKILFDLSTQVENLSGNGLYSTLSQRKPGVKNPLRHGATYSRYTIFC